MTIKVLISSYLIENGLTTNYEMRKCRVRYGLPQGCKLIESNILDNGNLELTFLEPNGNDNDELLDIIIEQFE